MSATTLAEVFTRLHKTRRKALIPFLPAGDPSIDATVNHARTLIQAGATILEIGFPYSDPIADGPVIQAAYTRALAKGIHVDDVFACAAKIHAESPEVPLVGMTSFALIHRRQPETFLTAAKNAGMAGLIVPDLPVEEASSLVTACAAHKLDLVQLVTPTTSEERMRTIVKTATGFVYVVSVTGITGTRADLPTELLEQLTRLRRETTLPLCVGFGVSRAEHAQMLREHVEGVIVGSAFVRLIEQGAELGPLAKELLAGLGG
jgi:tryptophan synthase alpha chain